MRLIFTVCGFIAIAFVLLISVYLLVPAIKELFDLKAGDSLLAAILVLAVMILPSIISVSETALKAVPKEYTEGSLALGATDLETSFKVILPAARSGVAASARAWCWAWAAPSARPWPS